LSTPSFPCLNTRTCYVKLSSGTSNETCSPRCVGTSADGKLELAGLEALGQSVFDNVLQSVQAELVEIEKLMSEQHQDELSIERSYHEEFIEHRNRNFVGRSDKLDRLELYAKGSAEFKNQPLVVVGEPGSGKSAIMAHFAHESSIHGGVRQHTIYHFVGVRFLAPFGLQPTNSQIAPGKPSQH